MPTRSRACTSWARTRRCRTPTSTTRARRWRISSISWCRTSSSPRPRSYADVILPASAWPEKDGTVTNTNRQVQMGRKALPLPGDARQDLWIIQEIAQRIGLQLELHASVSEVYHRDGVADAGARQHLLGARRARGRASPIRSTRRTSRAATSCSTRASRARAASASWWRPSSRRRTRCRTPNIRSSSPPAASSSTGTPAR